MPHAHIPQHDAPELDVHLRGRAHGAALFQASGDDVAGGRVGVLGGPHLVALPGVDVRAEPELGGAVGGDEVWESRWVGR